MKTRDREHATLSFAQPGDRGAVEETFYPWDLTVRRFLHEGLPPAIGEKILEANAGALHTPKNPMEKYLQAAAYEGVFDYEIWLGFDPVRRVALTLPLRGREMEVFEDTPEHTLYKDQGGRVIDLHKQTGVEVNEKYAVSSPEDWFALEELAKKEEASYLTPNAIETIYGPLRDGHARGDYSVRMHIEGFFWTPRELMGTAGVSLAFYDMPAIIHRINQFALDIFMRHLSTILEVLPADVLYLQEDISGVNGPLISPRMFDEFVAPYYSQLVPMLRSKGVRHVLVDTDGDFRRLIPNFTKVGVDGFLPVDVNAGVDIVSVREQYPDLQFVGGFNKLRMADGPEAIDQEFQRLLPVIRQGGYLPGADHQVAPNTPLEYYKYYIGRLKEVMAQAGVDS
ncbi:MAG: uroporphyrinogen decarboxylase family protein [Acidimicrobiales bacterium]|jgi:hypothetical protein